MSPTLPAIDPTKNVCYDPHVVLLGAGASVAALPDGDRNGRRLPLMGNLVEVVGLERVLNNAGVRWKGRDFERVFSEQYEEGNSDLVKAIEKRIRDYFQSLSLPDEVTLYDEIILSLRDKDLVATFNWDPLLVQAYRRNLSLGRLPKLVFLHGNVAIGSCPEHRKKGYLGTRCDACMRKLQPVPLLYPISSKDYTADPFIRAEWAEFEDYLGRAYLFTIMGYSAPAADVGAVRLLRDVWSANPTRELAQLTIVDIKDEAELEATWKAFFVRDHYSVWPSIDRTWLYRHPRRTCDAFAMATLQLNPCKERSMPRTRDHVELRQFVRPLVDEEVALELDGDPLPC